MRVFLDQPDRISFSKPRELLVANQPEQVYPALFAAQAALARGFHVAGWLSYELGYVLQPRLAPLQPSDSQLLCLGVFDGPSSARPVALVLAIWCVVTAIFFHRNFADQNIFIHFLKNLMIAGGLLQIVHFGAGVLSVDNRNSTGVSRRSLAVAVDGR